MSSSTWSSAAPAWVTMSSDVGSSTAPITTAASASALAGRRKPDAVVSVAPDEKLADALGERYDSLTAMECITALESAFELEVDFVAHDVRYWFATVERMARFIADQREDRALLGSGR